MSRCSQFHGEFFFKKNFKRQVDFLDQNSSCLGNRSQMVSENLFSKSFCHYEKQCFIFILNASPKGTNLISVHSCLANIPICKYKSSYKN